VPCSPPAINYWQLQICSYLAIAEEENGIWLVRKCNRKGSMAYGAWLWNMQGKQKHERKQKQKHERILWTGVLSTHIPL
jgi:ribosomal protein L37AE/L43A